MSPDLLFCDKQKKAPTPLFTATTLTAKSESVSGRPLHVDAVTYARG
ncbi:hypothetical protein EGR_01499 [Echinococcus granulosus]|uniref:Uncharacterized protein n=1 Tax=Echinococcus granulosus TaxID=6210 RepID=W6UXU8_ECHGR|nr:hypothetical protein EGR_01499 [Echinococcus granulosus]EUB63417.1 hypothetical protein EGR_01499 [Echinococcus granulosus]